MSYSDVFKDVKRMGKEVVWAMKYEEPKMEIISLVTEDIITASDPTDWETDRT